MDIYLRDQINLKLNKLNKNKTLKNKYNKIETKPQPILFKYFNYFDENKNKNKMTQNKIKSGIKVLEKLN